MLKFFKNKKILFPSVSIVGGTKFYNGTESSNPYLKHYKITANSKMNGDPKILFKGAKTPETQIHAPLEHLLGALCACEYTTASHIAKAEMKINIKAMTFKNVEGIIDTHGFFGKADPKTNKFSKIKLEVYIETDAPESKIEELKEEVEKRCPIHNMLHLSGVEFESVWTKK